MELLNTPGAILLMRTEALDTGDEGDVVQTSGIGINGEILLSNTTGYYTSVTLTFDNAGDTAGSPGSASDGVEYRSLTDGYWQLSIPSIGFVGAAHDTAHGLYRLFGDINGDGTVDALGDELPFGAALGSSAGDLNYVLAFDFNNDGTIDSTVDQMEFGLRFGSTL